jgi:hypothetical protein
MAGLKKLFSKSNRSKLTRLPSGAFALDRDGRIVVSTLPRSFPEVLMRDIGKRVLEFFNGAQTAQVPMQELNVYYPSLKVTARNLRGGAIIFLAPQLLPKNN